MDELKIDEKKTLVLPKQVLQQLAASRGYAGKTLSVEGGVTLPPGAGNKGSPIYVIVEEGK